MTSLDLYKAKQKCLELQKTKNRIIINGSSPILLVTKLLKEKSNNDASKILKHDSLATKNSINNSYLDALILKLNEISQINGIINYDTSSSPKDNKDKLSFDNLYIDKEIKKLILEENIHAIISLSIGANVFDKNILINEKMSSYSFIGLTGISKQLAKLLQDNSISNHQGFGGQFHERKFRNMGYDFTDETIAYNNGFFLGTIKFQKLPPEKIWPRSIDLIFKEEIDNLCDIGEVLI